ncbi:MAG: hypothetical protein J0L88_08055 [Xanthomonadales bacterium]|nr:hypothetical protein [Xanthomonadales bacterium]
MNARPSPKTLALLVRLAALAPLPAMAGGPAYVWPYVGGFCSGTLQACIDAVPNGSTVLVAAEAPIDENLALPNRSLTLTRYPGFDVAFAAGRSITANLAAPAGVSIRIDGFAVSDASVAVTCSGGSASVRIENLRITRSIGGAPAAITATATSACTLDATVYNNRVHSAPAGINSGLVGFSAVGATLNGYAAYNHLERSDDGDSGGGLFVDVVSLTGSPGGGFVRAFGNEIRGNFGRGGLFFSEGLSSSTAASYSVAAVNNVVVCRGSGSGIAHAASSGTIATMIVNNTVSGCSRGVTALRWNGAAATSRINGYVWNNVLVATNQALTFTADLTPALANDYNLLNAPSLANVGLGPNTFSAPAQFVADAAPRLRAGSSAIDSADGVVLSNVLVDSGLPATDADGLRRVKGGGADRGAYESGDVSALHVASAANALIDHVTGIDLAATNGQAAARVLATRNFGTSGPFSAEPYGVYYAGTRWALYHESFADVAPGLKWNLFVPAAGAGVFTHAGTAANTAGSRTEIDNAATNGQAGRIVLVTHNWTAQPTYITHMLGVQYSGSGSGGRWNVTTIDRVALPTFTGFNLYAQSPSPNAFRIEAPAAANRVVIDHPLVHGVRCAVIHATRVVTEATPATSDGFDLDYNESSGRWGLFSVGSFPADTAFNVVIDPAQVFDCTDRIFANGYD